MALSQEKHLIEPKDYPSDLEFFLSDRRDAFVKCSCGGNKRVTNKAEIKTGTELYQN